ncbi:TPA: hypothetical protein ACP3ZG_004790 [Pseudomonas aeruginosa]|uniref:Uncharacterized protein n=1 Tax=Pseudomonas aeruginosa TaxID=287 RepID=A0A241XRM7_PSEAI|nr:MULTISPECIES: hypothetical protein [Pseudomonas]ELG7182314.1 hypothetical protein [Pseudomonas aeruginosa]MBI6603036.1 hypothetical protein [Pseudomonas sp. S4_EA_1b]MBI8852308.1 hypothetical protein [Pseudomonas aeruginosa]OBY57307.1 hypothetical protein A9513_015560 [Pseudomonas sp. AU12215]OTI63067.1 hypothetical protein CAZ10_09510 [Pseudomonas aeruginosa]
MNTYVLFPGSEEEFEALIDVVASLSQEQLHLDTGVVSGRFQIIEQFEVSDSPWRITVRFSMVALAQLQRVDDPRLEIVKDIQRRSRAVE